MIQFADYSFTYAGACENALSGVDFTVLDGAITVLAGASGSGKTTLLKSIKREISPAGKSTGSLALSVASIDIAMVFQAPETQLVCGSARHDLVFAMENMGFARDVMKRRLAETCCYFGLESLLHKKPDELSGGQKQLVALCAALMVQPKLLLLDEPLSQLDPIATAEFLDLLKRINQEFAVTIILSEHRLCECIAIADQIAIMDGGKIVVSGAAREVFEEIWRSKQKRLIEFIPEVTRVSLTLFHAASLSPKELKLRLKDTIPPFRRPADTTRPNAPAITIKELVFSYQGTGDYVLRQLSARMEQGKLTCMLGGNGSGKSTLLKLIAGLLKPSMGKIKLSSNKIAYMPQTVNTFFSADSVYEEITFAGCDQDYYTALTQRLELSHLETRHPFDLSGGEAVRVCLAAILLTKPDVILLDEPTRGLDGAQKSSLAQLLKESGAAVLMATHDLEFAAQYGQRCILIFDGDAALDETTHEFFKSNRYYTTGISKAFRHICTDIVTAEDVMRL